MYRVQDQVIGIFDNNDDPIAIMQQYEEEHYSKYNNNLCTDDQRWYSTTTFKKENGCFILAKEKKDDRRIFIGKDIVAIDDNNGSTLYVKNDARTRRDGDTSSTSIRILYYITTYSIKYCSQFGTPSIINIITTTR